MVLRTSSISIFVLIPSASNDIIIHTPLMGPINLLVVCVLLGKLASLTHTHRPWRLASRQSYWQPPRRIGCCFASADLAHHSGMMCGDGGGAEDGMGQGGEDFCSTRFLTSIDHDSQHHPRVNKCK